MLRSVDPGLASWGVFAASNWRMPQRVTVYGAEDADAIDDTATARHGVSGGDYGANGVTAATWT